MALPPVFIEFLGSYAGLKSAANGVKTELAKVDAESKGTLAGLGAVSKGVLLGIGATAAGVVYESAKLATNFQAAMEPIHTQAGVAQSALSGLGNQVLNLAGQVGFAPDSLAESLYHVESSFASIGIKAPEAMDIVKTAAEGAAVGNANLVDVTNALDAAIASGIPGVQNYSQAMGALNAIVGSGDMQMQDLADALGTGLLAVVKGYGLSLTDTGAALATFGDNNIRGAQAATDLRMAVQSMAVPASTAGKVLKQLGLSSDTLAKDMQTGGLSKALKDLHDRMTKAGLGGKKMSQTLTELVGKRAGSGLDVLLSQYDRVLSKYPEIEKGAKNFDSDVTANNKTLKQHMADAKTALDALGVKIGTALLPAVTKAMGGLSKVIGYLSVHTGVFYAIAAGIGVVGVAFLAASIASWSFTDSILADPVFLIVLAIAALVAGIVELVMHWKAVAAWLSGAWHTVVKGVAGAWHWLVAETKQVWHDITGAITGAWHKIYSWFSGAISNYVNYLWIKPWRAVSDFVTGIWQDIAGFFVSAWHFVTDPIKKAWDWVSSTTTSVWNHISAFFEKWWPLLLVIFATPIAVIMSLWNHTHEWIFNTAKTVWGYIEGFFRKVWSVIVGIFRIYGEYLRITIITPIDAIWHGIVKVFNTVASWLEKAWVGIVKTAKTAWRGFQKVIIAPIEAAWAWLKHTWSSAEKWLSGKWDDIKHFASTVWAKIKSAIVDPIGDAYNTVKKKIGDIASSISKGLTSAVNGLKNIASQWVKVGEHIIEGIASGIKNKVGGLISDVKNVAGSALHAAKSFLGIHSPSRLFADEVGQWISKGIAQGVNEHAGAATGAVRNVANGLTGSLGNLRTPSLGTGAFSGGGVVQNVIQLSVAGHVLTDKDLRDLIQEELLRLDGRSTGAYLSARV